MISLNLYVYVVWDFLGPHIFTLWFYLQNRVLQEGILLTIFSLLLRMLSCPLLTTKIVHFMKLSKCGMDLTITFPSSRWSKNIYGTSNSESG
jgi:hypothetical protein